MRRGQYREGSAAQAKLYAAGLPQPFVEHPAIRSSIQAMMTSAKLAILNS